MTTVNKPILLDETGKDIAAAIRQQTEAIKNIGGGNPADYIIDCEYNEGEVTVEYLNEETGETVIETVPAITSWYEIYNSGKVRQGGAFYGPIDLETFYAPDKVTFSVPLKDKVYDVSINCVCNSPMNFWELSPFYLENTGFFIGMGACSPATENVTAIWTVEGMGANL